MTDDEFERPYGLLIERLYKGDRDELEEFEGLYREAVRNRNVRIAAVITIFIADIIDDGRRLRLDVGTADDLSDPVLADAVRRCQKLYVDSEEAARMIGCTPQHIRRLARQGCIQGRRAPDGSWRCNAASVSTYRKRGT